MQETDRIDDYILKHIDGESEYLKALYRDTHVRLLRPRMASGHLQGRLLTMLVRMIRPRRILEIGTYSGYSSLCLAEGLEPDGRLYTFEINDEQEDFTRPWLEGSPYAARIEFIIGDALKLVPEISAAPAAGRVHHRRQHPLGRPRAGNSAAARRADPRHHGIQRQDSRRPAGGEGHPSTAGRADTHT